MVLLVKLRTHLASAKSWNDPKVWHVHVAPRGISEGTQLVVTCNRVN